MHDFTWKSFFMVWLVLSLGVATLSFVLGGLAPTEALLEALPVMLGGTISAAAFLYIAFAPFVVAYLEAYRDERQRGRPVWYCALAGLFGMFGLVLVLIPVGAFVAAFGYIWVAFESGMKQHWLTAAALAAISVLLGIAFWADVIITRININKLRMFKPSNERRIMRK